MREFIHASPVVGDLLELAAGVARKIRPKNGMPD